MVSDVDRNVVSDSNMRPISTSRLYVVMAAVTVVSAAFQATHMEIFGRLFGRSTEGVFLWNFGILGVIVVVNELVRRGKKAK